MDISALTDDSCGLYFLAGLDSPGIGNGRGSVTIHAAQGSLTQDNLDAIAAAVAVLRPGFALRIKAHSEHELRAPDSLESFAKRFRHDRILVDPTGSFGRASKLVALGRRIRAEFGPAAGQILWQADTSALVIVAAPGSAAAELEPRLQRLFEQFACPELRSVVRSVALSADTPAGRYTPLDTASIRERMPRFGFRAFLARLSGAAAILGLGTLTAAHASAPPVLDETDQMMPGISALVGLTTLGESTFGARNRYQAVGGLRLYFGDAGAILVAGLAAPLARVVPVPAPDVVPRQGEVTQEPERPAAQRIAYGA